MIRSLISTFVACVLVTLVLSQRHAGFMLFLVALILIPWLIYSAWVAVTKPTARKLQLAKVGIWVLGVAVIVVVHAIRFETAQKYAGEVASAVEAHFEKFGSCPRDLAAVGISQDDFRKKLGYAAYICESAKPTLFYGSTFIMFETESYDFGNHTWIHNND